MLTTEQIIKLHESGFTADQIETLKGIGIGVEIEETKEEETKEEETEKEKTGNALPVKQKEKTGNALPVKQTDESAKEIEDLKTQISSLTETIKGMQEKNAKSAQQEAKEPLTAESVIQSFMVAS